MQVSAALASFILAAALAQASPAPLEVRQAPLDPYAGTFACNSSAAGTLSRGDPTGCPTEANDSRLWKCIKKPEQEGVISLCNTAELPECDFDGFCALKKDGEQGLRDCSRVTKIAPPRPDVKCVDQPGDGCGAEDIFCPGFWALKQ